MKHRSHFIDTFKIKDFNLRRIIKFTKLATAKTVECRCLAQLGCCVWSWISCGEEKTSSAQQVWHIHLNSRGYCCGEFLLANHKAPLAPRTFFSLTNQRPESPEKERRATTYKMFHLHTFSQFTSRVSKTTSAESGLRSRPMQTIKKKLFLKLSHWSSRWILTHDPVLEDITSVCCHFDEAPCFPPHPRVVKSTV